MRLFFVLLLQLIVFLPLTAEAAPKSWGPGAAGPNPAAGKTAPTAGRKALEAYGRIPLYFIKNTGQVDGSVRYYEKGPRHAAYFTDNGLVLSLSRDAEKTSGPSMASARAGHGAAARGSRKITTEAVRLSFVGRRKDAAITAERKLTGRVNYFVGRDPAKWRTGIPAFGRITYRDVYDNIDIRFYGTGSNIEHDVVVRPGGDPGAVRFAYKGVKGLELTPEGDLLVRLDYGVIREKRPLVYQEINGKREIIESAYRITGKSDGAFTYGFDLAAYDRTKELVIDPVIVYSTYLGGSGYDSVHGIAVDSSGAVYVTGFTDSLDFPVANPVQGASAGGLNDTFITKLDPQGTAIVFSTYLGGGGDDFAEGIGVDASGAVYITGITTSVDFPVVNAFQGVYGGTLAGTGNGGVGDFGSMRGDAFITKLDPTGGAIAYSTYLGGSGDEIANDIFVESTGAVYVTGETTSTDFPIVNPIQPAPGSIDWQAFAAKVDPSGTGLVYSTYLGGSVRDAGISIAADGSGAAYVAGETSSTDFPVVNPVQGTRAGGINPFDFFVAKLSPAGSALTYSTYLGGSGDERLPSIAVDSSGSAYITGYTGSTDYPVVSPLQATNAGGIDIVVSKIDPTGSAIVYSTYIGGSGNDFASAITIDAAGSAYVAGLSYSSDYPLASPLQASISGYSDAVLTEIDPAGSAVLFSTYLGGQSTESARDIALDASGAVYLGGWTTSGDFPLVRPYQVIMGIPGDAFITKVDPVTAPVLSLRLTPDIYAVNTGSTLGYNVTAVNTTAAEQCFQYWEKITLPGGSTYPQKGELVGPVSLCLGPGAAKTTHLAHGVPISAPLGAYALNAYVGAYGTPAHHVTVSESHFTFNVTAPGPMTRAPATTWDLIDGGFGSR